MTKFLHAIFPSLLLLLTFGFTEIKDHDIPDSLLGSWEYDAPSVGLNYQKGLIEFSHIENELKGNVIFWNRVVPMKNLIYEENKVRAHILLEGQQIDLFLKFQEDNFQGTVSHPSGYIRISGKKVKDY